MPPRVWTRGIRTSPLAPFVSSRRIRKVATTSLVAWTTSFPLLDFSLAHHSSPRLHRRFGKLGRSCHGVSGRVTPPSASSASLRHRCRVGCSYRASVSLHCLLRCELTSPEFRRGHRCRGQGSLVHHFLSFFLYSFASSCCCSTRSSTARSPTRDAGDRPRTAAVPPFARARSLGRVRVRVSSTNRRGNERGAQWCP